MLLCSFFFAYRPFLGFFSFFFSERNCGGDGHMFLYFPQQSVEPCVVYSWSVTVFVGDDRPLFESTLDICDMQFLAAPEGLLFALLLLCSVGLFLFKKKKKKKKKNRWRMLCGYPPRG